ncbi:MAG: amidohydrolase family protein [Gemmatimonadota bacterium]
MCPDQDCDCASRARARARNRAQGRARGRSNRRVLALLPLLVAACGGGDTAASGEEATPYQGPPAELAITDVHVVDVVSGEVQPNRIVALREGEIVWVGPSGAPHDASWEGPDTRVVNGEQRYLIPGLWDMHIHLRGGAELEAANRALLPLYVANGVTTVRDAGGDLFSSVLAWRDSTAAGTLLGPRIFSAGPKLEGPTGGWDGSIRLSRPEEVPTALDSLERLGVDLVKVNDVSLPGDVYLAAVEEAARRGLLVTGHMPFTVRFREVVDAGISATSHLHYVFKGSAANEEAVTREFQARWGTDDPMGLWAALGQMIPEYDPEVAQATFRHMAEKGTAAIPTLHIMEVLAEVERVDHSRDAGLQLIHPGIEATYQGRLEGARNSPLAQREEYRQLRDIFRRMIVPMHEAGVQLLAGSDAGPFNAFVYPGFGLHSELEALVGAGLSPADALRTATTNAAAFMKDPGSGQVAAGFRGDLVLLAGNPLEEIGNVRGVETVILRGRQVLDRGDLDALLQEAAAYRQEALGTLGPGG